MWWISNVCIMCTAGSLRQQKPVCCQGGEQSLGKQWPGSVQSQQYTTWVTFSNCSGLTTWKENFPKYRKCNCLALTRMKYWFWRWSKTSRWLFSSNFHVQSQHLEIQKYRRPNFSCHCFVKKITLHLQTALGFSCRCEFEWLPKQDGAVLETPLRWGWSPVSAGHNKIIKGLGWKGH